MRKILTCIVLFALLFMHSRTLAASLPDVVAGGALLLDTTTGKILYEKNMDTRFYPASTTKIMTALLTLENCSLDEKVTVGKKPPYIEGSKIYLFEDEVLTVEQLLYALLIESGNDVALALAEHISGSEEAFAQLMTKRAKQLGCRNTNFTNPHGLYNKNHYTTAYDLSLIAREAMKNEVFRKITTTKLYALEPTNKQTETRYFLSKNKIIFDPGFQVKGANGIKTGYTSESGHSFVGSAYQDDTKLMVVLLNDKKPGLWEDASSLLNYGFSTFKTVKKVSEGDTLASIKVEKTDIEIPLAAKDNLYYTYPIDEIPVISTDVVILDEKDGSIVEGEKIGYAEYNFNGSSIGTTDLIATESLHSTILYKYKSDTNGRLKKVYNSWILLSPIGLFTVIILTAIGIKKTRKRSSF